MQARKVWQIPRLVGLAGGASCTVACQVEALAGKRVLHAACGVWHSAAVAADLLGGAGGAPPDFISELGYAEGLAAAQKLAAAYALLDQARCMRACSPVLHSLDALTGLELSPS